jgi:hypothetical protein
MTDKEFVLSIYPEAEVEPYIYGHYAGRLGPHYPWEISKVKIDSELEAWNLVRKEIEEKMLKRLER